MSYRKNLGASNGRLGLRMEERLDTSERQAKEEMQQLMIEEWSAILSRPPQGSVTVGTYYHRPAKVYVVGESQTSSHRGCGPVKSCLKKGKVEGTTRRSCAFAPHNNDKKKVRWDWCLGPLSREESEVEWKEPKELEWPRHRAMFMYNWAQKGPEQRRKYEAALEQAADVASTRGFIRATEAERGIHVIGGERLQILDKEEEEPQHQYKDEMEELEDLMSKLHCRV